MTTLAHSLPTISSQATGHLDGVALSKLPPVLSFTTCARRPLALFWRRRREISLKQTRTGVGRVLRAIRTITINPAQFLSIVVIGFKAALSLHDTRNHCAETYPHSNQSFRLPPCCFRSQESMEGFENVRKVSGEIRNE